MELKWTAHSYANTHTHAQIHEHSEHGKKIKQKEKADKYREKPFFCGPLFSVIFQFSFITRHKRQFAVVVVQFFRSFVHLLLFISIFVVNIVNSVWNCALFCALALDLENDDDYDDDGHERTNERTMIMMSIAFWGSTE